MQDLVFRCKAFPRPGETIVGRFVTGPGGKGSNQAVAAARAGGRVAFIGAVGNDAFGTAAREFQEAEGIDCRMVQKTGVPTGSAGILVNGHGQNEIIIDPAANSLLSIDDVDAHADVLRDCAVVVTQLESDIVTQSYALHEGRSLGATTILNPAPMGADFDAAILTDVDILVPNETEFCALSARLGSAEVDDETLMALPEGELHAHCRRFAVATVIVTLGSRGCFVSQASGHAFIPAMRGIEAVDTTGAGDAFVGAFAAALVELGPGAIEQAARFANAAAALSVTRAGTAPSMPRRAEIDELLARRG